MILVANGRQGSSLYMCRRNNGSGWKGCLQLKTYKGDIQTYTS